LDPGSARRFFCPNDALWYFHLPLGRDFSATPIDLTGADWYDGRTVSPDHRGPRRPAARRLESVPNASCPARSRALAPACRRRRDLGSGPAGDVRGGDTPDAHHHAGATEHSQPTGSLGASLLARFRLLRWWPNPDAQPSSAVLTRAPILLRHAASAHAHARAMLQRGSLLCARCRKRTTHGDAQVVEQASYLGHQRNGPDRGIATDRRHGLL
jgi:hypothetical protein